MDEQQTAFTEVIIKSGGNLAALAEQLGVQVEPLFGGYAIVTLPAEQIAALYANAQVEAIELPKDLTIEAIGDLSAACVRTVQDENGYNLRGRGVIVAVIDYGIDYLHRDFRTADGQSRILYLWDQTIDGAPPQGFFGGTEYDRTVINRAIASPDPYAVVPSRDISGHGTAVAGIAAGGGMEDAANVGVAPEAELIIVKLGQRRSQTFARTTELMRAVKYVIEKARALARPVAINISFGMNEGSHRGDSLFETYLSEAAMQWKTSIVVPTGNEASAGHHTTLILQENSTESADFFVSSGVTELYVSVWKDFADAVSAQLVLPDGSQSERIGAENPAQTQQFGDVQIRAVYALPTHYSVRQEIFFRIRASCGFVPSGLWQLRFVTEQVVNGSVDLWLPTTQEVSAQTRFARPVETMTMTIPSTAEKVIKVAGYNDRLGSAAEFSGIGAASESEPRPDLAAPAVSILTTKSGGGYDTFTGTSMAAPFVTGAAALLMQWGIVEGGDAFLYAERLKAFLRLGAERSPLRVYPNAVLGYGTLCLQRTMEYLVRYSREEILNGTEFG